MREHTLPVIGRVHSPYADKFAVPRQPNLAPHALSFLELFAPYGSPSACEGLAGFSHLIVLFVFHQVAPYAGEHSFKSKVRPPRLGGNERVGVFASRSPFRPSRLGMSVVELQGLECRQGLMWLKLGGADLVDGTPVVDIKPYLPFADSVPLARSGYVDSRPGGMSVRFTPQAQADLQDLGTDKLQALTEILSQDPRPAYRGTGADEHLYGALIYGYDLHFKIEGDELVVLDAPKKG